TAWAWIGLIVRLAIPLYWLARRMDRLLDAIDYTHRRGRLDAQTQQTRQARRTDAADAQGRTEWSEWDYLFTLTVHPCASVRLAVFVPPSSCCPSFPACPRARPSDPAADPCDPGARRARHDAGRGDPAADRARGVVRPWYRRSSGPAARPGDPGGCPLCRGGCPCDRRAARGGRGGLPCGPASRRSSPGPIAP